MNRNEVLIRFLIYFFFNQAKSFSEKAKALKAPIKHLTSSDSAFGRSLEEKKKDNDE